MGQPLSWLSRVWAQQQFLAFLHGAYTQQLKRDQVYPQVRVRISYQFPNMIENIFYYLFPFTSILSGPAGLLGAAEGLSFLTVLGGIAVLGLNYLEFGSITSTLCDGASVTNPLSWI